ncbi:hypothetical protein Rleg9DRAFT_0493 [Rhizobium leguminosarum bv. trifolii WSM597]|uniref:Uncharacterized protein n=1 Tax=Rhizobium leguminosarum bv. trifolii WSM597 TaxID=754764 RepID=I9N4Y0_RHILT|nr:hypothetical protein [Rhizobium leguminosarum]EJB01752.1 hypothetical protein Rleg9DRAFT_0493 [Rhizobium leguminosarum bv. trifolii WSM597]
MRRELDAREYKLLLDPTKFDGSLSLTAANDFWYRQICPVVDAHLDRRKDGGSRACDEFNRLENRLVRFWDTPNCTLSLSEFVLRSREPDPSATPAEPVQLTLKLRMEDYFVVSQTQLPGTGRKPQTELEEDIAPLEVATAARASGVVLPLKPSVRSRYSLSTKVSYAWHPERRTTGHLGMLFPTLANLLRAPLPQDAPLIGGPKIRECLMKGAKIRLGDGIAGEITLTFWRFGPSFLTLDVAEVSFKCDLIDHAMSREAADRALRFFLAIQTDLAGFVTNAHSSKTAQALPAGCTLG